MQIGQASGAIPNGTRIVKMNSTPHDGAASYIPDGMGGTVAGSIKVTTVIRDYIPAHFKASAFEYLVKWDSDPRFGVFVVGMQVARK
jgi:hypothetical protein